ncbi:MAG: phosphate starvation-inducible protein PhoH [Acidobacteria bacterium]|nr:MAG: phosphate starvation-inducible protein PhoH [Acidobacteriota bacterium]PIE90786.1 MAG: phosphate starvation-inducible protein PhoH [Acidobacteriota bacterium]
MKKTFVLDTNVLLHDPNALYKFQDNQVIIPLVVVEEIDKFKRTQNEVGRNARTISRFLDEERAKGSLSLGVQLKSGGFLKVVLPKEDMLKPFPALKESQSADNIILGTALSLSKNSEEGSVVLVTKDTNLRIKADASGLIAQDYFNDKIDYDDLYTGHSDLEVTATDYNQYQQEGVLKLDESADYYRNQFIFLKTGDEKKTLTRYFPNDKSVRKLVHPPDLWGIKPLNDEQSQAMELLCDPNIKLVSLLGKAGTGKTLLAIAAGLKQVVDDETYKRLLISRPVLPLGKDLGYLPGDVEEKLKPWMQPIIDNLEFIISCSEVETSKGSPNYQYLVDHDWISVEPLTYMRGRSIPNQYMIVDEAQNLTPHEIKSVITRAGHGTKIVLTGDPHQIDNPFLDASSNGISYLVQRFKGQDIYGHVTLTKGERSVLAELASNLL